MFPAPSCSLSQCRFNLLHCCCASASAPEAAVARRHRSLLERWTRKFWRHCCLCIWKTVYLLEVQDRLWEITTVEVIKKKKKKTKKKQQTLAKTYGGFSSGSSVGLTSFINPFNLCCSFLSSNDRKWSFFRVTLSKVHPDFISVMNSSKESWAAGWDWARQNNDKIHIVILKSYL